MAARSWSGLFATPPPMTISEGLKKLTMLASIDPTRRPASPRRTTAPRSPLAEGQQVDVVVDPDRRPVPRGEPLPDRVTVPAGHDRRRDGPPGFELHRSRDADPDAPQVTGQTLGRPNQRFEEDVDAVER